MQAPAVNMPAPSCPSCEGGVPTCREFLHTIALCPALLLLCRIPSPLIDPPSFVKAADRIKGNFSYLFLEILLCTTNERCNVSFPKFGPHPCPSGPPDPALCAD